MAGRQARPRLNATLASEMKTTTPSKCQDGQGKPDSSNSLMQTYSLLVPVASAVLLNSLLALRNGASLPTLGLCSILAIGFSIPLLHAVRTRSLHTLQSGVVSLAARPIQFLAILLILLAGFAAGFIGPWLL